MQEIEHLVKMANQIADNFSFYDDAVERTTHHLQQYWAPSMQKKLVEFTAEHGSVLKPIAREALQRLVIG